MGEIGVVKVNSIKQIFETMEYGNEVENITQATEWLKTKENSIFAYINKKDESPNGGSFSITSNNDENLCTIYTPDEATTDTILTKVGEAKNAWLEIPPLKRSAILQKLGNEIRKKQELFIQLEVTVRGILRKDIKKKALPALTDSFQYYSSFSVKYSCENPSWKPEGLAVCVLPDENCLSALGYALAPCLASGYNIILQTGPQLSVIAALLIDTATQAGIPEGTIRLIPGNIDPNIFFIHPKVSVISIFDDLYKEKYLIANHFNKKLLYFCCSGTSMIVFENCDIDSACHGVIDGVWGYKGVLPWSVRNILIQENIFERFIEKLKNKISHLKVGASYQKNLDISYPDNSTLQKVAQIVEKAKTEGVEIYKPNADNVVPVLLIGGNVFHNNVIKEELINVPVVTLTAFRTINEAVALSNNTRQGLGASVWTESTSLVHEIIGKLKVGNIWVNSHGLFSVDIATSPYKTSGNVFLGGSDGFYEYVQVKTLKDENISQAKNAEVMEKAITEAKKVQDGWSKLSRLERIKTIQGVITTVTDNKNWNIGEKWLEDWNISTHDYVSINSETSFTKTKNFNVVSTREPCGVLAVETAEDKEMHNKKLVIAALVEGNCVIILNDSKDTTEFYFSFAQLLPKGVLKVLPHTQDATKVAALHKELNVYIGQKNSKVFFSLPLKTSNKFKTVSQNNWREIRSNVSLVKNVWFNIGQSFI